MKILLLHGLAGSHRNFDFLIPELKDWETITLDLIGYGKAPKPDILYDLIDFTTYLEKHINFNQPLIIIGHSLGAVIARHLARKHKKVKKVFFINYPLKHEAIRKHRFFGLWVKRNFLSHLLCITKHIWKFIFVPVAMIRYPKYWRSLFDYFKHTYASEIRAFHNTILRDTRDFSKIKARSFFIYGSEDPFTDKKYMKGMPRAEIFGMKHALFGFEKKIANIILKNIK